MYFNPNDYKVVKSYIKCVLDTDFIGSGECNYNCEDCEHYHKDDVQ